MLRRPRTANTWNQSLAIAPFEINRLRIFLLRNICRIYRLRDCRRSKSGQENNAGTPDDPALLGSQILPGWYFFLVLFDEITLLEIFT